MTRDELRTACAKRLIDVDPTVEGYHEENIAAKIRDADAVLRVALGWAAERCADFENANNRAGPYGAGLRFAAGLLAGEIRALMPEDAS